MFDAEDKMPVWNLLEYIAAQPLPEFDHAFLMTGWAAMPAFAGESQKVLVVRALNNC
ncbi:MAG: hypothetical protein Q7J31_04190 [Syntrophales bacterium]|nr:hypothetical protein [Syntrophales bacterium]